MPLKFPTQRNWNNYNIRWHLSTRCADRKNSGNWESAVIRGSSSDKKSKPLLFFFQHDKILPPFPLPLASDALTPAYNSTTGDWHGLPIPAIPGLLCHAV
jgi:hypothetical protein